MMPAIALKGWLARYDCPAPPYANDEIDDLSIGTLLVCLAAEWGYALLFPWWFT